MRLTLTLPAAIAVTLLASCGGESRRELSEAKTLVTLLRRLSPEVHEINSTEFEFVEDAKRLLFTCKELLAATKSAPEICNADDLQKLRENIQKTADRRQKVKQEIDDLKLTMPLPIAIQSDLNEVLAERIAFSNRWRIQVDVLEDAVETHSITAITLEVTRLSELFQAYGPLQNPLKRAADDLEEQLQLQW